MSVMSSTSLIVIVSFFVFFWISSNSFDILRSGPSFPFPHVKYVVLVENNSHSSESRQEFNTVTREMSSLRPLSSEFQSTVSPSPSSGYDVTLTTQSTIERVEFFPFMLERWTGEFSIAMFITRTNEKDYRQAMRSTAYPDRLHLTEFIAEDNKNYPINMLRNLAIEAVKTSHFWLADMDMWPSLGLREALMELPSNELARDDLAVIVPAFELKGVESGSWKSSALRASRKIPNNRSQLKECIAKKRCSTFRPKEHLHDYFFDRWYDDNYQPLLTRVRCFKGSTQEPYVMVKKTDSLPRFDERFINYGYNKVQWLEHLRFVGYDFQILTKGFAVDIPHRHSKYWGEFIGQLYYNRGPDGRVIMRERYHEFLQELKRNFTNKQVI
ncbi:hypothetical protein WA171_007198, partial [Blastocystis sp. BT1]